MNSKDFERLQGAASNQGDANQGDADQNDGATDAVGQYLCGDIDIRIKRDGTWFYHGSPIGRKPLVKLFASVLSRDDMGDYWLITPVERARIAVDDAPFVAVEMRAGGKGQDQLLEFRTNLDDWVKAGAGNPIRVAYEGESGEPAPYVRVRDGMDALIARSVFYDLVALGVENHQTGALEVWSGGHAFVLGPLGDTA